MKNRIVGFRDENGFLSNFYNHTVKVNGLFFKNNVAAFLAQMYPRAKQKYFTKLLPSAAIRFFDMTRIDPPADWDERKEQVMYNICKNKFTNQKMKEMLLATGDAELVNESNFPNDYWGTNDCVGENMLGKILMRLRAEFAAEPKTDNEAVEEAEGVAETAEPETAETAEEPATEAVADDKPKKKAKKKKNENDESPQATAE